MSQTIPTEIRLKQGRAALELVYGSDAHTLSAEYLRVYSPSAEVRGHGVGQEVLQVGKIGVLIADLEPVGQYALKITFSDGHNSGLYDWDYLHKLATDADALWADYLQRLHAAGASREAAEENGTAPAKAGCGSGSCGCKH